MRFTLRFDSPIHVRPDVSSNFSLGLDLIDIKRSQAQACVASGARKWSLTLGCLAPDGIARDIDKRRRDSASIMTEGTTHLEDHDLFEERA